MVCRRKTQLDTVFSATTPMRKTISWAYPAILVKMKPPSDLLFRECYAKNRWDKPVAGASAMDWLKLLWQRDEDQSMTTYWQATCLCFVALIERRFVAVVCTLSPLSDRRTVASLLFCSATTCLLAMLFSDAVEQFVARQQDDRRPPLGVRPRCVDCTPSIAPSGASKRAR